MSTRNPHTGGYVHISDQNATLERTQPLKLVWHSLPGGLGLFAVFGVAALAIIAFGA